MAEMSELGQFLFELCSTIAKERARLYQHDKAAALDADRALGIVTPTRQTIQKCASNDCDAEAVWPSRYCGECAAEIGVGA